MDDNKMSRIKVEKKDKRKLEEIEPELYNNINENKKRTMKKNLKKAMAIIITIIILSSIAMLTLKNYEARIQVRCDGVREFPAPEEGTFRGDITLYDHLNHKYFAAPIKMRGTGKVATAEFYNDNCVYAEDPNFRWG